MTGAFTPLSGFMTRDAYDSVVTSMRLPATPAHPASLLFPMPVVLDAPADCAPRLGSTLLLRHRGLPLALMRVDSVWRPDKAAEAHAVLGTTSLEHPGVRAIASERGPVYLGGPITAGLALPTRPWPSPTPAEIRARLRARPFRDVVAFQCRNPVHRAHHALYSRSLTAQNVRPGATLLIHPTVGPTQEDDIPGEPVCF